MPRPSAKRHRDRRRDAQQRHQGEVALHVAKRLERSGHRRLQHGHDAFVGARSEVQDARDRLVAELRVALAVGARVTIGRDVARERRALRFDQRGRLDSPLALVLAGEQRHLETRERMEFLRPAHR